VITADMTGTSDSPALLISVQNARLKNGTRKRSRDQMVKLNA
jgi:hypothetical protein